MNKLNNEIAANVSRNSQLTDNNKSLQTTKIIKQLGKSYLRFFAIVLGIAAFTFLPAQAQEQTIEDASIPQAEKQEIFNQDVKEKLIKKSDKGIPGQYIVVFKDWAAGSLGKNSRAPKLSDEMATVYGGKVKSKYQHALNGYAAKMTEEEALAISQDERVAYVEQDQVFSLSAEPQNVSGWGWGLDRINQMFRPLDGWYTYNNTGAGVNVYVIDSGIKGTHPDFGGRVVLYRDFIGGNGQDCNGHGTHVAGTIAGATVGVAKQARLISLRVLNCSGNTDVSAVIRAVDWVTAYHAKPAVVNISGGVSIQYSLDLAVQRSINAGVTYVVAAGNDGIDANYVSPARVREAITVGATDRYDYRADFGYDSYGRHYASNYGTALDLFAPGKDIVSACINCSTGWIYKSGTSMAAPHVAGTAAISLQYYPNASPAQVHDVIVRTATTGVLGYIGVGSPNRLLDSLMWE
ncbi:MAG: S8 family peptidase [Acidobacteria bacterium]|jgi:subtilisin family serine protease|nr:S8 family peptidase [Acidobacteriota bacterium]